MTFRRNQIETLMDIRPVFHSLRKAWHISSIPELCSLTVEMPVRLIAFGNVALLAPANKSHYN